MDWRRTFRRTALVGALAALLAASAVALATTTVTTPNGTWTAYPGQSAVYQASVQQPIRSANTSNWSSKAKGGIPIMFKLSAGVGPFVFESFGDNTPGTYPFSFLEFEPATAPTLSEVISLIANYQFTVGDCHAGSLRWTLYLDDGGTTRNLDVHYQPGANALSTQSCQSGTSGSNRADLTSTDPYVVINQFTYSGTPYTFSSPYNVTWAEAVAELGSLPVEGMNLIVDSGFAGNEEVALASATVGVGGATPYTDTFTPQPPSALAPTCNLPAATLVITKTAGGSVGPVNQNPVQKPLADTGNQFRVVDCKYQYILSIPSLKGPGKYEADIQIGGVTVGTATFGLR